jgi:hypothetical protein
MTNRHVAAGHCDAGHAFLRILDTGRFTARQMATVGANRRKLLALASSKSQALAAIESLGEPMWRAAYSTSATSADSCALLEKDYFCVSFRNWYYPLWLLFRLRRPEVLAVASPMRCTQALGLYKRFCVWFAE